MQKGELERAWEYYWKEVSYFDFEGFPERAMREAFAKGYNHICVLEKEGLVPLDEDALAEMEKTVQESDDALYRAWGRYWEERIHRNPIQSQETAMKEAFVSGYNAGLARSVELIKRGECDKSD